MRDGGREEIVPTLAAASHINLINQTPRKQLSVSDFFFVEFLPRGLAMETNNHVEFHPHQVREHMYRLIISQLFQDGHGPLGISVATALNLMDPPCPPSDQLYSIITQNTPRKSQGASAVEKSIDLNDDSSVEITSPPLTVYEFAVSTGHRGPINAAAFNSTGKLVATGSEDGYIKIFDVEKMIQRGLDFHKLPSEQVEQVRVQLIA